MQVYAQAAVAEMPDASGLSGPVQWNSWAATGQFMGRQSARRCKRRVHINAFNFPVWGMLEKARPDAAPPVGCARYSSNSPRHLSGDRSRVRLMIQSGTSARWRDPTVTGAWAICWTLDCQDVVISFTGSSRNGPGNCGSNLCLVSNALSGFRV